MHHSESRDGPGFVARHLRGPVIAAALSLIATTIATPVLAQTQQVAQPDLQRQQARANRANWTLAERFNPVALRPVLYTNAVAPRWLGKSDTLWYNWRDKDGSHFYLVVPDARAKRALFDREKLAAQLAELSRKPVDPKNLPFTTLNFTRDHRAFRFTADSMRYEYTLATSALKSLGKPPKIAPKDEERDVRGGQGGGGGQGGPPGGDFRGWNPDSTAFAFARNHNLFIVEWNKADTLKSDTTQVTTDGVLDYSFGFRDTSENRKQLDALNQGGQQQDGVDNNTDDANSKEPRVRAGVVWSPDSKSFAVVRQDQRKVTELYLVNALANPRPTLLHYRYAMPGEDNVAQSELWVYKRGDKAAKQLKVARWRDQRLMNVHFPVTGDRVRMVRRDRAQRNLDFVEIDVATNAVKTLLTESIDNASLDPQPVVYTKKGGDFLWWSERSGWGQLYAYDFDGGTSPKYAVTSGAWHVEGVAGVDSTKGTVWLTGMGREANENVYYQHLYRAGAGAAGGLSLLDPGNFTHNETLSPTRRFFVDSYSRLDAATKTVLRDATTGRVVMDLEEMDIGRLKELGWRAPEMFVVKAADGVTDIYGNMWKPFDFDSTKKYPIVANVYPGPQTEGVTFNFSPASVPQYMAQLGIIVIQIGNRGGSPQRSLAFHRYGYYNARDYALADKKSGIEQLAARHSYIDLDRVGIYGHSGGGFLTAAAMLQQPYNDFFKVGWSESGNHDNNIYNQNWSEWNYGLRVMAQKPGLDSAGRATRARAARAAGARGASPDLALAPDDTVKSDTSTSMYDSTRYEIRVPTNVELAGNLKGNLALMTGDLDNNVHPGNTIRLANALIKANKRFDFFIVPGQPHGYRDMVSYTNHMMLEYFAEHLLGDYYRSDASMK